MLFTCYLCLLTERRALNIAIFYVLRERDVSDKM